MRVTIDEKSRVNIEGISGYNLFSLSNMLKRAISLGRRDWVQVSQQLNSVPLEKLPLADSIVLAKEVKEMRRLQAHYFKTRSQDALKASIAQERKVDDLVNDILNKE